MRYTAEELKRWEAAAFINGRWIPARPLPFYGRAGLAIRIKTAFDVLIGKADALYWGDEVES